MPERDQRLFLEDILEAIRKIKKYTRDMDFEEFVGNELTFDAVVKNLSEEIKAAHPEIQWGKMAGMRDRLIHGYFGIDEKIVCRTVEEDLLEVEAKIGSILEKME